MLNSWSCGSRLFQHPHMIILGCIARYTLPSQNITNPSLVVGGGWDLQIIQITSVLSSPSSLRDTPWLTDRLYARACACVRVRGLTGKLSGNEGPRVPYVSPDEYNMREARRAYRSRGFRTKRVVGWLQQPARWSVSHAQSLCFQRICRDMDFARRR